MCVSCMGLLVNKNVNNFLYFIPQHTMFFLKYFPIFLWFIPHISNGLQIGPDPWDYEMHKSQVVSIQDEDIPPDLKATSKRVSPDHTLGDIFFRRLIAIIMKGSQTQKHEDGSVEVLLHMRFDPDRWSTLDRYMKSNTAITESVLRLAMGYIEDAIYKPTIIEKVIMAWSDYVQIYLTEYKIHIMWTFAALATVLALNWLRNRISHKHILLIIFITLYFYEVFISYKEAEQQELARFISALNKCKWQFWTSTCEAPTPDLVSFLKHMNPLKIAVRMFTTIISEPMLSLSFAIKTMVSGITDGLWFPFDKIVYGILTLSFNALLIVLLVLIIFNYILNIPFSLSFLLFNIAVKQRNRTLFSESDDQNSNRRQTEENVDRISGATLNRLLDVFSHAISNSRTPVHNNLDIQSTNASISTPLRRSASTGRLPCSTFSRSNVLSVEDSTRRRKNVAFHVGPKGGGGDAR